MSKQDVSVEHRVSVALLVFKRESSSEGGSADKTAEEKQEGGTAGCAVKVTSGKTSALSGAVRSRVTKK